MGVKVLKGLWSFHELIVHRSTTSNYFLLAIIYSLINNNRRKHRKVSIKRVQGYFCKNSSGADQLWELIFGIFAIITVIMFDTLCDKLNYLKKTLLWFWCSCLSPAAVATLSSQAMSCSQDIWLISIHNNSPSKTNNKWLKVLFLLIRCLTKTFNQVLLEFVLLKLKAIFIFPANVYKLQILAVGFLDNQY